MKTLKKIGIYAGVILAFILLMVLTFFLSGSTASKLLAPKGTIYSVAGNNNKLIFVIEVALIIFAFILIKYLRKDINEYEKSVMKWLKKHSFLIFIFYILIIYIMSSDWTYITGDKIIKKSVFNVKGKSYSYSDVVGVDTGFYGKKAFWGHNKGDFYYFIRMKDGTRIEVGYPDASDVNEEKFDNYDSYMEVEQLDKKLMENGATKISNLDYMKYFSVDKVYKERLKRIINNK